MDNRQDRYFDYVVLGGGIYGLYAAHLLAQKDYSVVLIESDSEVFGRASYINQARVHKGYHYLRSVSTAKMSARYFNRFCDEFRTAINNKFKQIYAISNRNSYTSHRQFMKFCEFCDIPFSEVNPSLFFNPGTVEGAYETDECSFDYEAIKNILLQKLNNLRNYKLMLNMKIVRADHDDVYYYLAFDGGDKIKTKGVINATYANLNQVLNLFGFGMLDIKYEICEVILCSVGGCLAKTGITVMDGPFFSIMPFGSGSMHSLTAVEFTPHETAHDNLPKFSCQQRNTSCSHLHLQNCNACKARPKESYIYMRQLAKKYLKTIDEVEFKRSIFAIKPIMKLSELDDSRPTVIKRQSQSPVFISVLSGKINTIYEMEGAINEL